MIHATDNCMQYMMNPYLKYLFRYQIIVSKSSAGGASKNLRYANFIRNFFVRQDYEFDQNFTFANLAKVFRFTFSNWISPSPLAKCEGLCAYLVSFKKSKSEVKKYHSIIMVSLENVLNASESYISLYL